MKLKLNKLKIQFPGDGVEPFSEEDIVEWLEFMLKVRTSISTNNPLRLIDIKDCKITFKKIKTEN